MSYLLIWVSFGVLTAIVAGIKGRTIIGWFLLGFLFSFFALIVLLVLPKVESTNESSEEFIPSNSKISLAEIENANVKKQTKICVDCAEEIAKMARVCKHCGKRYDEEVDNIEARIEELKKKENEIVASKDAAVGWLARKGLHDINGFDRNNQTPLMFYALKNDFETVEQLLLAGADIDTRNMAGFTAADKAEREGLDDMATYIRSFKRVKV